MRDDDIEDILREMRREDVPDDVHELARKVSEDFEQGLTVRKHPNVWEAIMGSRMTILAATAAIIVVTLVGIGVLANGSISFADVIEPILNARAVELDIIVGDEKNGPVVHDVVVGSKIRRTISNMDTVLIIDLDAARMLTLDTQGKTAAYVDIKGPLQEATKSYLGLVRNVVAAVKAETDRPIRELGKKEVDGRTAVGFQVSGKNADITIWADPKSALAVRIELVQGTSRTILKNIRFDGSVDEARVSMNVPDGYTNQKEMFDMTEFTEEDFTASLRMLAELFGDGVFPDDLRVETYMKRAPDLPAKIAPLSISIAEKTELGMQFGRGLLFFQTLDREGSWRYSGKGVKLGDADKTVFSYQPKGSQTRRVIYGDLNVKEVAPGADAPE